jgi:hypothetical protein
LKEYATVIEVWFRVENQEEADKYISWLKNEIERPPIYLIECHDGAEELD